MPYQAGQFPSSPGSAADRQGRVPARGASFPAPPTSPKLPPGDTRFRRPPGPNTRARCQFPSSSHVPEVTPGWCPFPAPPGPNTRAKCQFPSSSHVPGVSPGWYPFPTPARAKHPRKVPVSQLLARPRSCLRVVPVSRRPPGPNTRTRCQFPSSSHVPGVSSRWCPFPAVNEFLLLSRGAAQAPSENN